MYPSQNHIPKYHRKLVNSNFSVEAKLRKRRVVLVYRSLLGYIKIPFRIKGIYSSDNSNDCFCLLKK